MIKAYYNLKNINHHFNRKTCSMQLNVFLSINQSFLFPALFFSYVSVFKENIITLYWNKISKQVKNILYQWNYEYITLSQYETIYFKGKEGLVSACPECRGKCNLLDLRWKKNHSSKPFSQFKSELLYFIVNKQW